MANNFANCDDLTLLVWRRLSSKVANNIWQIAVSLDTTGLVRARGRSDPRASEKTSHWPRRDHFPEGSSYPLSVSSIASDSPRRVLPSSLVRARTRAPCARARVRAGDRAEPDKDRQSARLLFTTNHKTASYCVFETCSCLFVSSDILRCRLLKWSLDHPMKSIKSGAGEQSLTYKRSWKRPCRFWALANFRGNHFSNTICLTHAFFKSGETCSEFT